MGIFKRALTVTLVAAASVVMSTGPASADVGPLALPGNSGYITFWDDINYTDRWVDFTRGEYSRNLDDLGFGDKASSYVNKTNNYWLIYDDDNFSDRALCVRPNSHINNLDRVNFGDKMSSLRDVGTSLSGCGGATPIGDSN